MPGMHDRPLSTSRDALDINLNETSEGDDAQTHLALRLRGDLDQLLAEAQPRLRRLARQHGLALDMADDVVQETLMEAWRSVRHLRDPKRFDAWLNGICRNVCRRQVRMEARMSARQTPFSALATPTHVEEVTGETDALELPDLQALDPLDALSRQDLITLLDRALSYLPPSTREALELCYLAEMPQREAAERLGLTGNALDVRLHRARRQLRQVLTNDLWTDARDFGLILDTDSEAGWRETRIWCNFCGRHRMQGTFTPQPDGRLRFHLRCPECWLRYRMSYMDTSWDMAKSSIRSFLPVYKRSMRECSTFYEHVVANGYSTRCPHCWQPVQVRNIHGENILAPTFPNWRFFVYTCPACCAEGMSSIAVIAWAHPAVQRFVAAHPRYIMASETQTDYAGTPAYRFHLTDIASAAQLTVFSHTETHTILATFEE